MDGRRGMRMWSLGEHGGSFQCGNCLTSFRLRLPKELQYPATIRCPICNAPIAGVKETIVSFGLFFYPLPEEAHE